MDGCIDIDKLARLARLSVEPSARDRLSDELAEIIGFAAKCRLACSSESFGSDMPESFEADSVKLDSVLSVSNTATADSDSQDKPGFATLRDDKPKTGLSRELLLSNAPTDSAAQSKFFSTVRVIEN